jgi:rubrerythrin
MNTSRSPEELQWRCQDYADRWNRLYPVGTAVGVRLKNGSIRETRTRSAAEVFEDSEHQPVAAVYLDGIDAPIMLADCLPEIPKELEFLLEDYPAEKIRQKMERIRDGLDLASDFFRLAKHWEYQAEKASEKEAEVFRGCAKQLKQRAQWLKEDLILLRQVFQVAPHLIPK